MGASPPRLVAVGLVVLAALAFHLWLAFNTLSNSSSSSNSRSGGSLSPSSSGSLAGDTEAPAAEPSAPFTPPGWTIGTGRGSEGQLIPPGAATALKRSSSSGGGRRVGWRKLGLYLLPRLAILLYFGIWCAVLPASGAFSLHLHHYALGWAAASFAAFNHPVSGLLLAAGTAVFVQVSGVCVGVLVLLRSAGGGGACMRPVAAAAAALDSSWCLTRIVSSPFSLPTTHTRRAAQCMALTRCLHATAPEAAWACLAIARGK